MHPQILFPFVKAVAMASSVESVEASAVPSLAAALNQRNIYMKDVAGYKAKNGKPVADIPREEKVMKSAVAYASSEGLSPDSVRPFIQAQMDVAKSIEQTFIDGWQKKPEPNFTPENLDEVRKKILEEDTKIIKLIHQQLKAGGFKESDRSEIYAALVAPNLTQEHRQQLVNTLFSIKLKTTR